jgi:hypothetical protein
MSVEAILDEVRTLSIPERKQLISLIVDTLTVTDADDDDEAEWERAAMQEALGDNLLPDGTIDTPRLIRESTIMELDDLYHVQDMSRET